MGPSSRTPARRTSTSSWTRPRDLQTLPLSEPLSSSLSPDLQPTHLRLPTLSSDAGSLAPRSTTRNSPQPPPLSLQDKSGLNPSHSMSHPLLHPLSTMLRSLVLTQAETISSP